MIFVLFANPAGLVKYFDADKLQDLHADLVDHALEIKFKGRNRPRSSSRAFKVLKETVKVTDPTADIRTCSGSPNQVHRPCRRLRRLLVHLAERPGFPLSEGALTGSDLIPDFPLALIPSPQLEPLAGQRNILYTDGSRKEGRLGVGVFDPARPTVAEHAFSAGDGSVLRAELLAILFSLSLRLPGEAYYGLTDSLVSLFLISGALAFPACYRTHEHASILLAICGAIRRRTAATRLGKVKGHSGNSGNTKADKLANKGADPVAPEILRFPFDLLLAAPTRTPALVALGPFPLTFDSTPMPRARPHSDSSSASYSSAITNASGDSVIMRDAATTETSPDGRRRAYYTGRGCLHRSPALGTAYPACAVSRTPI